MRATTLRFPPDLWDELERQAQSTGVSVAEYLRQSAILRLVPSANAAGEPLLSSARYEAYVSAARDLASSGEALRRQSRLAIARAERLRAEAAAERARRFHRRLRLP
jgi:hypothetical protein